MRELTRARLSRSPALIAFEVNASLRRNEGGEMETILRICAEARERLLDQEAPPSEIALEQNGTAVALFEGVPLLRYASLEEILHRFHLVAGDLEPADHAQPGRTDSERPLRGRAPGRGR